MFSTKFSLLFLGLLVIQVVTSSKSVKEREILDRILDKSNYDKRIRPDGVNGTDGTIVNVNLYVRNIDSVDDQNMEFSTQLTFRMQWLDERLVYESQEQFKYLSLLDISQIWVPDLFFSNEKEGHSHDMLTPNTYARISPDGSVLVSQRLTLKLSCPMSLKYFPMDTQVCFMKMASYGYTTDDLIFKWKEVDPVQITSYLHLPNFALTQFTTDHCDSQTNTGIYSCLRLELTLKREFSYYLTQVFIPSIMLVIVAWLSFWVNSKQVVGRIIVTLITLLVMAVQASKFNENMPQVSYTRAIDMWFGICNTFLFGAFVEFIIVHYLNQKNENEKDNDCTMEKKANYESLKSTIKQFKSAPTSEKIDMASRVVYPVLFLLFNIVYWSSYKS